MACSELMNPGFANGDRSANASSTHIPIASISIFLSTEKAFCKAAIFSCWKKKCYKHNYMVRIKEVKEKKR